MTSPVLAYAARDTSGHMAKYTFERRDLRPDDVRIDILYCGVCHTDLHQVKNDWGRTQYPLVPGHEIVGRVSAVGSDVTKFSVGDAVAVGCLVDSCQSCHSCESGEEQYCFSGATQTYGDKDRVDGSPTQGGYSTGIVVREKFVLRVPEGLDLAAAAPLLCAGITTYSPLSHYGVNPGDRVAVVGLGGLGHMAIKFAAAMGAEVTLFTTSPAKVEEAKRLGAHKAVISKDPEQMKSVMRYFDLIIDTVPTDHAVAPYMMTLRTNGNLVMVGHIGMLEPMHTGLLMGGRKSLSGSAIGGIEETQKMLDYCAEKNITCDIETIAMADINTAYERMEKNDVHYRFVIDMSTLA